MDGGREEERREREEEGRKGSGEHESSRYGNTAMLGSGGRDEWLPWTIHGSQNPKHFLSVSLDTGRWVTSDPAAPLSTECPLSSPMRF